VEQNKNNPQKVAPVKRTKKDLKPRRKYLSLAGYGLLCGFAIVAGIFLSYFRKSEVVRAMGTQAFTQAQPGRYFEEKPTLTILLLGCDEDRAPGGKKIITEQARSDMMLVAKFDFKHNRITGVSIPRDLLVQLPGYRPHKINAYHKYGGKELAKKAAELVLQHPIDKVIAVNYKIMQEMVDMIGGVVMFVPKKMRWIDRAGDLYIDLKPGRQKLNGYNAMCFVRYRYGDSDWHRQQRQKEFLLTFKDAVKDAVLRNPGLIPSLAEKSREIIGNELTPDQMAALALFAMRIGNDNIKMGVIPTIVAGHYYLRLDEKRLPKTLKEYHFVEDDSGNS
jgi:LCP family protein required for cell wall assembly